MNTLIIKTVKAGLHATVKIPDNFEIKIDSHLRDEVGIDSLTSMDFLMYLEDHIEGFYVDANTLIPAHFNTVTTIVEYINSQLNSDEPAKIAS
ncbi:MAG: acyl carrier protein [Gammaproteobacteria bacterium]|nr:acyl carrier protein [Gammaproteobacteria bacterium]